jgi:hypothetical protein
MKIMDETNSWKAKTLLIGTVIGALSGLGMAFLLVNRADEEETRATIGAGEGIQLGLAILGLLRLVSQFTDGDKKLED